MTTLRRFTTSDLFKFNSVNLDVLTETYNNNFYLNYLAKWPEYFIAAESEYDITVTDRVPVNCMQSPVVFNSNGLQNHTFLYVLFVVGYHHRHYRWWKHYGLHHGESGRKGHQLARSCYRCYGNKWIFVAWCQSFLVRNLCSVSWCVIMRLEPTHIDSSLHIWIYIQVAPAYRRQSLARTLMQTLEETTEKM